MLRVKGFTLIELLIVVAVVAILAAIAIPNFLQAQIRTKVSRAKSDLRTIATALELYRVDQNDYPPNTHADFGDFGPNNLPYNGLLRYNLTTPTDYLVSRDLRDPFVPPQFLQTKPDQLFYTYQNIRWYRGIYPGDYRPSVPATGWILPDGRTRPEEFYGDWRACSYGPDQKYSEVFGWGMLDYDPTNGTISNGNIWLAPKTGFVSYHPGT